MARPSKLTPDVKTHILLALRAGSHLTVAAASAGVCEATLHRWLTDRRPQFRAFAADARQAIAEGEVVLVGRIGQAVNRSPGVALKLLERRHPQRWAPGRADALAVPDEFAPETPAPGPPKPLALNDEFMSVSEEWQVPLRKIFYAIARGRTPAEFFEGPDLLASLRESDPLDPWWKLPGEPLTPTLPATPADPGNASAGTPAPADSGEGPDDDHKRG
jgi:hypothetical protein